MSTRIWTDIDIPVPFDTGLVENLRDMTNTAKDAIDTFDAALQTFLDAVEAAILSTIDPLTLAAKTAAVELRDVIQGLLDLGISATWAIPNQANDYNLEACLNVIAQSLLDDFDNSRPIKNGAREEVYFICFTARAPSFTSIGELWQLLKNLIKLPDFPNFENAIATFGEETPGTPLSGYQTQYPDWIQANLMDYLPPLKEILETAKILADRFVELFDIGFALIEDLKTIIQIKVAQLREIARIIDNILTFILVLLANDAFEILYIQGEFTAAELAGEIVSAVSEVPTANINGVPLNFDNTALAVAFCAVGPTIGTHLEELMGL